MATGPEDSLVSMMAKNRELCDSIEHAHSGIEKIKEQLDRCMVQNGDFLRRLADLERENAELKSYS